MHSTMPEFPLTIGHIFRHGQECYPDSLVVTNHGDRLTRVSFADLAGRAGQLAGALRRLGVEPGDRVGTFAWNNQEHQEAYFAIPCMGAVMHTVNIRLSAEQIRYVVGHAEEKAYDRRREPRAGTRPVWQQAGMSSRRSSTSSSSATVTVRGCRGTRLRGIACRGTAGFRLAGESREPEAAAMCYTSGTTDRPKGVVYSHRSTFLHSLGVCSGEALGLSQTDRLLPVVPMFHGNAWRHALRRLAGRRRLGAAGPIRPGRAAGPVHRDGASHRGRGRADGGSTSSAWTRTAWT